MTNPYSEALSRWSRRAAAPVPKPEEVPRIGHILRLAEIIREVDGKHDKGAAALAEAILSHPGIRSAGLTAAAPVAIPGQEYHEDMGPVTWWRLPVDEPPWVGTPNDSDWPGYHTHFTPAPTNPLNANALPTPEAKP